MQNTYRVPGVDQFTTCRRHPRLWFHYKDIALRSNRSCYLNLKKNAMHIHVCACECARFRGWLILSLRLRCVWLWRYRLAGVNIEAYVKTCPPWAKPHVLWRIAAPIEHNKLHYHR